MSFWEPIKQEIFDNQQLDIYEKMCLLVLMSRDEEEINITSEELSTAMGCGVVTAKRAFDSLRIKGYFTKDYKEDPPVSYDSSVIKSGAPVSEVTKTIEDFTDTFREGLFTAEVEEMPSEKPPTPEPPQDTEEERRRLLAEYLLSGEESGVQGVFVSQKEKKQSLVDELIEFIDEKISFKEANILLGFAGNDIERIKREYKVAKASQVSDTMGVLINALQKKSGNVIKSDEKPKKETQIDTNRLRKMQAYRNGGLK